MAQSNEIKNVYEKLLDELTASRAELVKDIADVNKCKDAVIGVASNTTDYRSRFAKEDRIKTISSFYSTVLALRQEYNRNIISEIELRRKLEKGDDGEISLDLAKIAKQLEARRNSDSKKQTVTELVKNLQTKTSDTGTK